MSWITTVASVTPATPAGDDVGGGEVMVGGGGEVMVDGGGDGVAVGTAGVVHADKSTKTIEIASAICFFTIPPSYSGSSRLATLDG